MTRQTTAPPRAVSTRYLQAQPAAMDRPGHSGAGPGRGAVLAAPQGEGGTGTGTGTGPVRGHVLAPSRAPPPPRLLHGAPAPPGPAALPGRARRPRRGATPRPPPPRRGSRGRAAGAAAAGSGPRAAGRPAAWPGRAGPGRASRAEAPSQAAATAAAATPPGAANGHSGAGPGRRVPARSPGTLRLEDALRKNRVGTPHFSRKITCLCSLGQPLSFLETCYTVIGTDVFKAQTIFGGVSPLLENFAILQFYFVWSQGPCL